MNPAVTLGVLIDLKDHKLQIINRKDKVITAENSIRLVDPVCKQDSLLKYLTYQIWQKCFCF